MLKSLLFQWIHKCLPCDDNKSCFFLHCCAGGTNTGLFHFIALIQRADKVRTDSFFVYCNKKSRKDLLAFDLILNFACS